MPVSIDKVMDAMSLPYALRDRPRYQEMAEILATFADRLIEAEIADEDRILEMWFKLSCPSFPGFPRRIYLNVPATIPSEGLAEALAADLDEAFFENDKPFTAYLAEAGVTFPLPQKEVSSSPLQPFDGGVLVDLPVMPCPLAPQTPPSEGFERFLRQVWEARETLAPMTAPQMAAWIYGNLYTQLSEPDKIGNLDEAGLAYLDALRRVGGSTKRLLVIGNEGEPIPKKKVPEWCTVGSAVDVARRVYVNVKAECVAAAMQVVCDLMETNADVPHAKAASPFDAGQRPDTIVVYTRNDTASTAVVEALLKNVDEGCFQERVPGLTDQVAKGIGLANDPQPRTGQSFGQSRTGLIAEALHDLLSRKELGLVTPGDLLEAAAAYFRLNGLDPAAPHRDDEHSYPDLTKPPALPSHEEDVPRRRQGGRILRPLTESEVEQLHEQLRLSEQPTTLPEETRKPPPVPPRRNKPSSLEKAPPGKLISPIVDKLEDILAKQRDKD